MPGFLKQATAAQSRALGPFIDSTDFKTPLTALTIANTDIKLVVNGGAVANKNALGGTHRSNGVYGVTFDATDTATVGEMDVSVVVAGALPVFDKFFVLEEAVYDAMFGSAAPGPQVPIWAAAGSTVNLSATTVAAVTTTATATAVTTVNGLAANVITATSIANDAITDAKVAADVTIASVTGNVGGNVVGTVSGVTPSTAAQVAAILTTQITESYRANAAAPTLAQFMSEVLAHLGEAAISGTTKTINKLDHVTAAATYTLDSATDPATVTRAT